jgi:hypothetical protein
VRDHGDAELATRQIGAGPDAWRELQRLAARGDLDAEALVREVDAAAAEWEAKHVSSIEAIARGAEAPRIQLEACQWLLSQSRPERYSRATRDAAKRAADEVTAPDHAEVRRRVLVTIARTPSMLEELDELRRQLGTGE